MPEANMTYTTKHHIQPQDHYSYSHHELKNHTDEVKHNEQKQRIKPPVREVTLIDGIYKCANCYFYGCECANCQGRGFRHVTMSYEEYCGIPNNPQANLTYDQFVNYENHPLQNTDVCDSDDDMLPPSYEADLD